MFENEKIKLEIDEKNPEAYIDGSKIEVDNSDGMKTFADFHVSLLMEALVKNRLDFIVKNQQYKREGSHLDGAFFCM